MGRIVTQWLLWDTPPADTSDAEHRNEMDPLCALCQSTGMVCPRCCGARWVRNPEIAAGSEHAVGPCPGCTVTEQNHTRYDAITEHKTITAWLTRSEQRQTHPVIANPHRLLSGDLNARRAQRERHQHLMALRGEQARVNYADYVSRHGDPRACLKKQIMATSQKRAQQISAQQISAQVVEIVRTVEPSGAPE